MKRLYLRLATLVLSVSVAILLAEGLVRLFVPVWLWKYRDATADWRRDPELGWTQKPNLDVKSRIPGRDWIVRFQTNPEGITPAAARRRRQPGTRRIMIFGDSTVSAEAYRGIGRSASNSNAFLTAVVSKRKSSMPEFRAILPAKFCSTSGAWRPSTGLTL